METTPPSQKLLFLSDVHLGGFSKKENERIERELIHLIDYCQENRIKIYILGDLFDYWMEYRGHVPEVGKKVRERFLRYNGEFGPTIYITGNHDNWTKSYLEDIGFTLHQDYVEITIDDKQILLLHGDGLPSTGGVIQRPLMHRILRNERFVKTYQKIFSPDAGLWVMKWFSRMNRLFGKIRIDPSTLDQWAKSYLRETKTDLILSGHDHIPREKRFSFGTYLNLGTFYKHNTAVLYNNNYLGLVVWNDGLKEFSNYDSAIF